MELSIISIALGFFVGLIFIDAWKYIGNSRRRKKRNVQAKVIVDTTSSKQALIDHAKEFEGGIVNVTDGVYVAIGYGLANSIMLEGDDGIVIVDTTESVESGKDCMAEFRKITTKPVKGIIYTHNHADHCYGTEAFVEDRFDIPPIWAHKDFTPICRSFLLKTNGAGFRRGMRQFGALLPSVINAGIGSKLRFGNDFTIGLIEPNQFLSDEEEEIEIAGIKIRLMHMPGETPDQMCLYLPDQGVLIPADNIYRAFPNLYGIRGTPPRDFGHWIRSLDRMRKLRPEYLVPCHSRPVHGKEDIYDLLTIYRDAIQLVNDQTLRYMNQGYNVDDIVPLIDLPPQLKSHPYLQQFYGAVPWCVRAQFSHHMGWFGGDPVDLNPSAPMDKAKAYVSMLGGATIAVQEARKGLDNRNPQLALELSSFVHRLVPDNQDAIDIRTEALQALAETQTSSNGRNYYLTCALEGQGLIENKPTMKTRRWALKNLTMGQIFEAMSYKLKAEECYDLNEKYLFYFSDTNEYFCLHIRNGIVEITDVEPESFKLKVTCTSDVWRSVLMKDSSVPAEIVKGSISLDGSIGDLVAFDNLFVKEL